MRLAMALGVLGMGSGVGDGQEEVDGGAPDKVEATRFAPLDPAYHSIEQVRGVLEQWVELGGENVRWVDTLGGALAVEFGAGDLDLRPLDERRTVLLVGGMDGRSVAGTEAVLHAGLRLLQGLESLRPDLTFLLLPCASTQGLALVDQGLGSGGRDLDGDGLVLQMLVEDQEGPWTPSVDGRFLCPAKPGDAPRFRRLPEGAEGGIGHAAFDLEQQFPLLSQAGTEGDWKLRGGDSQGVAQALRRYLLQKQSALVISFQGNHGGLAYPGASANPPWETIPDLGLYQQLGRVFRRATGRSQAPVLPLLQARGGEERGSFVDWCYAVPGVMAIEVAPWGMGLDGTEFEEQSLVTEQDAWDFRPPMDESSRRWAHWLDEKRGGMGFADWRPIVNSSGESSLVGGWKPKTFWNPPEDELPDALRGLDLFVSELVEHLPYLELCDVSVVREGELCRVSARLRCVGSLPLRTQAYGRWGGADHDGDAWLKVQVPGVVQLIAGPERSCFMDLSPGGRSKPVNWLLHAPEGARLDVSFGLSGAELGHKELSL